MSQTPMPRPPWHLTDHARRRADERQISLREILDAAEHPQISYDQDTYGLGRQVRQRGRISIVVDKSTGAIITVVFRDPNEWAGGRSTGRAA